MNDLKAKKTELSKLNFKKTDIKRILRNLDLLKIMGKIDKKNYERVYNSFYTELKGGLTK